MTPKPLPSHAQVVVIGGGIIGCSTAYHLARDHGADVLLIEMGQLTSGSTWHAAGLVGQLRSQASITRVLKYSVDLYRDLEAETGLATGWKMSGCLRLATNADRWLEYRRLATTARSFGMDMALVSPAEVKEMWPLIDIADLVGASWLPTDGQANPSDITQSLAKGARMHGARIVEGVQVTGFAMDAGRITGVQTDHGMVGCETVINCGGQWARQIGARAGVTVPLQPVKHQYIITEAIPGLSVDAPTLRDPDRRTYFKEEVGGLVIGGYEPDPQPWETGLRGGDVPNDWQFGLFDDDYDHFGQHLEQALARVPALEHAGIKQMINGSESFTPDGNFILGRANTCANMYVGAGFNAYGIAAGGGAGWVLAEWAMTGEAPMDLWAVDIRRFSGLHEDRDWVRDRTLEAYGKHYAVGFPHAEMDSGRCVLTSPLFPRLKAAGAVFGAKLGWERPNWFAPKGTPAQDEPTMGRPNWWDAVAGEHAHVRNHAGLFDQSSFAKFEVRGPGAAQALDTICAANMLKDPGRLTYTQLLNSRGGIEADLTAARLRDDLFYVVTGTGFRTHDFGWIVDQLPAGVRIADVTEDWGVLSLMGPKARDIAARVSDTDMSNAAFPFGTVQEITIAGHTVRALRLTYVGELGWELHMALAALGDVYDALMAADPDLRPVGYRALESLRLEKGYRAWSSDITPGDTPFEAGLGWAVKMRSGRAFTGRSALERQAQQPLTKMFAGFTVEDPDAILLGRETILRDGIPVGYLTSGGFGHTIGKAIGYGYVRGDAVDEDYIDNGTYALDIAGDIVPATITTGALFDPGNARVKA